MSGCGECTACCTLMAVESLNKPRCVTCKHLDGGCSIYEHRPQDCREFECIWLQTQATTAPWPKRLRPDRCGTMFTPTADPNTMAAHGSPLSLQAAPLRGRVKQWLGNGLTIINVHGDKRTLLQWKKL
jgi:hypothetical protein